MELDARKIAEDMAERCARSTRGDPDAAVQLGYAVVAHFLILMAEDYRRHTDVSARRRDNT